MSGGASPVLDPRDARAFLEAARARIEAFVPGWRPAPGDPGLAVAAAFARSMEALGERINQAPTKNQLAFYDLLGASLLPAAPARAPIVFRALPNLPDSRVPAGTRVGAQGPDGAAPLVFETEEAIGLAAARLAEVVTLWPGRDAYADHGARALRGQPFTLFEPLAPVAHELYLGHDLLLALTGPSAVEVRIELATPGERPLPIAWEYWDGAVWRRFKDFRSAAAAADTDSLDGTLGLTRGGTVRLVADCAASEKRRVHTAEGYWIRARLDEPLPPAPGARVPEIERITLQTTIDRRLPTTDCTALPATAGILPDHAYANDAKLDPTKAIEPMGGRPALGDAFYVGSDEVFGRPGAEVTLCFRKVVTPEEKADEEGAKFELDVANVQDHILQAARDAADAVLEVVEAAQDIAISVPIQLGMRVTAVVDARDALATDGMEGIEALDGAVEELRDLLVSGFFFGFNIGLETPGGLGWDLLGTLPGDLDEILPSIGGFRSHNEARLDAAFLDMREAAARARAVLDSLKELTPYGAALAAGADLPAMADPEVAWEYWNGRRWQPLSVTGDAAARTLTGSGPVAFTVPDDLEPTSVGGIEARWVRARLVAGGYGIVRLVSWEDEASGKMNFFPIVEYRPPNIDRLRLGYRYRSPRVAPERCLALNDFRFADRTAAAAAPGAPFPPFAPVADATPALYLGFDGPLPADALGFFFDLEEVIGEPAGPELVWEHWDGSDWVPVRAEDGTRGFAVPGRVRVLWPGTDPAPRAEVLRAAGREVVLHTPAEALRFAPDDLVWVESNGAGELATVALIHGARLVLEGALADAYGRATVSVASLPRFGTPRTWLRARLAADAPPRRARMLDVYPNAAWAAQIQTFQDEVVGSSNGELGQVFFARNTPVLEEVVVEVRELEGPRADIEAPLLLRELEEAGHPVEDVRFVRELGDSRIREVWVRWRERANLLFSGPDAREVVLERTQGGLVFGGNGHGRIPPAGADNIRLRRYAAGGGAGGNVAAGAIDQLLSGVLAEGVTNPRAAEGGADGERPDEFLGRGPVLVRHRRQAISRGDYEDMAREASPAVAVARALPATAAGGRHAPGWVTVQIVPESEEPRPYPSAGLRERVRAFLEARAPAPVAGRIRVVPPEYLPVGVDAVLAPVDADAAGAVVNAAEAALRRFLHPLRGGPAGRGWPFGRDVHASDVAALLAALPGVDYVERLALLVAGTPTPSPVAVPPGRLVAAGPVRVTLTAGRSGAP